MASIPTPDLKMRWQRLVDLLLVLAVAISESVIFSIFLVITRMHPYRELGSSYFVPQLIDGLARHLISIALLVVLLARQGRSLIDIGFRLAWKDIARTILLTVVSTLVFWAFYYLIYLIFALAGLSASRPANIEFLEQARHGWYMLLAIPYAIINPFFEELIVRAYLITEVEFLTGRKWLAVLISVAVQVSYHFYQGAFPALCYTGLFLVYSLYYVRTRRITPVIFAHMIYDLTALLW